MELGGEEEADLQNCTCCMIPVRTVLKEQSIEMRNRLVTIEGEVLGRVSHHMASHRTDLNLTVCGWICVRLQV